MGRSWIDMDRFGCGRLEEWWLKCLPYKAIYQEEHEWLEGGEEFLSTDFRGFIFFIFDPHQRGGRQDDRMDWIIGIKFYNFWIIKVD
ncbi:MAG: hypothetical protein GY869_28605 [Planctomycetes bacterium]|nr:hypothetical protein [Planctomycetota bacterium]